VFLLQFCLGVGWLFIVLLSYLKLLVDFSLLLNVVAKAFLVYCYADVAL